MIGKKQVADYSEHKDLEPHHDEQHRENGEREVFDLPEPFEEDVDTCPEPYSHEQDPDQPEVEERVVGLR